MKIVIQIYCVTVKAMGIKVMTQQAHDIFIPLLVINHVLSAILDQPHPIKQSSYRYQGIGVTKTGVLAIAMPTCRSITQQRTST